MISSRPLTQALSQSSMNHAQIESNRYHRQYYAAHDLFEAGTWLEKPNGSVMEIGALLTERENVRALDLGTGVGRNSIPFVKLFGSSNVACDCVDILSEALEKLRENAIAQSVTERIFPICSSIADYHIAPNAYDMVMAMSVLEHAYDTERIHDGIRMIQDGTRINGFNCLSIATDLEEADSATRHALEPIIQAHLSAHECRTLLSGLYSDWDIQRLDFSYFKDNMIRDGRSIERATSYCLFVARKVR